MHHLRDVGDRPPRSLIVVSPAGLGRYFLGDGRLAIGGDGEAISNTPEDIEKHPAMPPQYGIEIRPLAPA